jgi:hypothetical protein
MLNVTLLLKEVIIEVATMHLTLHALTVIGNRHSSLSPLENKKLEIIVRSRFKGKYTVMALVTCELVWIAQLVHGKNLLTSFK